jgi:hypothetical protein
MRLKIIILVVFSILKLTCIGQELVKEDLNSKYEYSLEIVEHFLVQNDRVLSKYYVNKNSGRINLDSIQLLNPKKIYFVEYASDSTIKRQEEFIIKNGEIDSLFTLVKDILKIDDSIGIRKPETSYNEGKYAIISVNIDNYNTRYWISVNLENESINRKKYYRIIDFLNEIKTAYNKG